MLCCVAVAAGSDADVASLRAALAAALEANECWERTAAELREALAGRDAQIARQSAELERVSAALAVLRRMVFGDSSERSRPEPPAPQDEGGGAPAPGGTGGSKGRPRGPGARAGRRDYPHLPRVEVIWDFEGGGYCCPECGTPFTGLGSDHVTELLDWQVTVRVTAHCRRRYRRACGCRVPAAVTAPGPPKAIGKGLLSNGFLAMLFTERFVAGRSMNSLVTGLARHGAQIAPGTLAGACAQAGALLAPLEEAIAERSRGSWHLHADETTWRVFAPRRRERPGEMVAMGIPGRGHRLLRDGRHEVRGGPGPHAGIDEETGQLAADEDGGPRQLVISSDFYAVYQSAGKKADGLVNLYCLAHIRRYFVRAGDANPAQLGHWTAAWLDRIRDLYAAHAQLMTTWQEAAAPAPRDAAAAAARLEDAGTAWDDALAVIDTARKKQVQAPGLQEPAKKALATLDREWDGLAAHRQYPMISLDNNAAERALRRPVVTRKNAYGSRNGDAARLAARIWTVTATAEMAGLNVLTYLTAYLDACGRNSGKPLSGSGLERFLPWKAAPADLKAWAQPPAPG